MLFVKINYVLKKIYMYVYVCVTFDMIKKENICVQSKLAGQVKTKQIFKINILIKSSIYIFTLIQKISSVIKCRCILYTDSEYFNCSLKLNNSVINMGDLFSQFL